MESIRPCLARFSRLTAGLIFLFILAGCAASPAAQPTRAADTVTPGPASSPTPTAARPAPTRTTVPTVSKDTCAKKSGQVELKQIPAGLPRPLQVRVYLPPCYDPNESHPYPVLVLLHGQASTGDQWERLGVAVAADRLIAAGQIAPLLVVLPQEDDTLGNPFESGYDRALVEHLLPWLEQNYPACAERECRALGGLSRGAAWAMYIGLSRPEQFAAIGAHSFPSFYGDENRLPILLREIPDGLLPRIWMDTGQRDRYLSQARHYHELLEQYKVPHEWHLYRGEHEEAYWSAHVEDYLKWYSAQLSNR